MASPIKPGPSLNTFRLHLHVKPGAKQSQITQITSSSIHIQIAAPPRDNEANTAVCQYLARLLEIRPRQISLIRGLKSRDKTVLVESEELSVGKINSLLDPDRK